MYDNTQVRLAKRPTGLPGDDVWTIESTQVDDPGEGQAGQVAVIADRPPRAVHLAVLAVGEGLLVDLAGRPPGGRLSPAVGAAGHARQQPARRVDALAA